MAVPQYNVSVSAEVSGPTKLTGEKLGQDLRLPRYSQYTKCGVRSGVILSSLSGGTPEKHVTIAITLPQHDCFTQAHGDT